jgi:hypothetical protein
VIRVKGSSVQIRSNRVWSAARRFDRGEEEEEEEEEKKEDRTSIYWPPIRIRPKWPIFRHTSRGAHIAWSA